MTFCNPAEQLQTVNVLELELSFMFYKDFFFPLVDVNTTEQCFVCEKLLKGMKRPLIRDDTRKDCF